MPMSTTGAQSIARHRSEFLTPKFVSNQYVQYFVLMKEIVALKRDRAVLKRSREEPYCNIEYFHTQRPIDLQIKINCEKK